MLATVGGVVTMAGLVLGVQKATDRFETWAYAWTLVLVVGSGIGRWLMGVVRSRSDLAASGAWLIAAGLVLLGRRLLGRSLLGIPPPRAELTCPVAALRTGRSTAVIRREPGLAGPGINNYRE
jgi:hypothetical protein